MKCAKILQKIMNPSSIDFTGGIKSLSHIQFPCISQNILLHMRKLVDYTLMDAEIWWVTLSISSISFEHKNVNIHNMQTTKQTITWSVTSV